MGIGIAGNEDVGESVDGTTAVVSGGRFLHSCPKKVFSIVWTVSPVRDIPLPSAPADG